MRTLVVQAASPRVLHCYANGGVYFNAGSSAARVGRVPGVRSAHLVTTGRSSAQWCLVVEPVLTVEQGHAEQLRSVASGIARRLGFARVELVRALSRPRVEQGLATDIHDWLKQ